MAVPIEDEPTVRDALQPGETVLWHSQPGAGRLFLSVVPRLLRDTVFLTLLVFAIYAGWHQTTAPAQLLCAALVLFLCWLLIRNLHEGAAARVSHYLITDRRLILLTPRAAPKRFVILARMPKDVAERHRANWFKDVPISGQVSGGRATIRVRYEAWMSRSTQNYPEKAYRTRTICLYAVADPERAVEAITRIRRNG